MRRSLLILTIFVDSFGCRARRSNHASRGRSPGAGAGRRGPPAGTAGLRPGRSSGRVAARPHRADDEAVVHAAGRARPPAGGPAESLVGELSQVADAGGVRTALRAERERSLEGGGVADGGGIPGEGVGRARNFVVFGGTAGQVERSLRTPLHRYEVDGEMHVANAAAPAVPEALAEVVEGFIGLDDFKLRSGPQGDASRTLRSGGSHYLAPRTSRPFTTSAPLYKAGLDGTGRASRWWDSRRCC